MNSIHRHFHRFLCLLSLSISMGLSLAAQLAPQDNWTYAAPDIDPPTGTSFIGPLVASTSEVFVGLGNGMIGVYAASDGTLLRQIGSFSRINGMVLDSAGQLWVLDLSAPRLTRVNSTNGNTLSGFGTSGPSEGQITRQSTSTRLLLGIDGNDQLYVADPQGQRVIVFAANGDFIRQFGESGNLIGQFSQNPRAIAVTGTGKVHLSAGRIYQFSDTGLYLAHRDWDVDNLFLTNDELVMVWDVLFSYDLQSNTSANAYGGPQGLAFQPNGTLWRINNGRLQQWRRNYAGADEPAPGIARKVPPQPRIVHAAQRQGMTYMDIDYEIIDPDSATVEVRVLAWRDGGTTLDKLVIPQTFVEATAANKGPATATNTVHRLTWDVAADFTEPFGYFEIEILAVDDQPLIPVHWITIPANEEMESFTISRSPVTQTQLLQFLLWEVAAEEGSCYVLGDAVFRKSDNEAVYIANLFNLAGVNNLLNPQGASWANADERARVSSGRFGQQSLSEYSMVRAVRPMDGRVIRDEMVLVEGGTIAEFEIGKFEVTYAHWRKVQDWGLRNGYTDLPQGRLWVDLSAPVAEVSWYDIAKWCNAKSEMEGLTPVYAVAGAVYKTGQTIPDWDLAANGYRLPKEAEWEYAARGGVNNDPFIYAGSDDINAVAWYSGNSGSRAQPVGTKQPNSLGLYDMSGNVWEWCWDVIYGSDRVVRGGSWSIRASNCAVSGRDDGSPTSRNGGLGFRLARSAG